MGPQRVGPDHVMHRVPQAGILEHEDLQVGQMSQRLRDAALVEPLEGEPSAGATDGLLKLALMHKLSMTCTVADSALSLI